MKKLLAFAIIVISVSSVKAQLTERVIVKAGDTITKVISPFGHYRFAGFTDGIATMKFGRKSKTRFNFHVCNGEMQFIDEKGDTLSMIQSEEIDNVTIGGNTVFVYANKYFHEIVAESPAGRLGKRIKVMLEPDRKSGFGKSDPTASPTGLPNVMFGSNTYALAHDVEVLKTTTYFWIDTKSQAMPASKKNLLKLVQKDKQATLQAFIDKNRMSFDNEEDLRKMLSFAATL